MGAQPGNSFGRTLPQSIYTPQSYQQQHQMFAMNPMNSSNVKKHGITNLGAQPFDLF